MIVYSQEKQRNKVYHFDTLTEKYIHGTIEIKYSTQHSGKYAKRVKTHLKTFELQESAVRLIRLCLVWSRELACHL